MKKERKERLKEYRKSKALTEIVDNILRKRERERFALASRFEKFQLTGF